MIYFEIITEVKYKYNKNLIERAIKVFSDNIKLKKKVFFTLIITGKRNIKKINRCYRGKDKITDVLSFAELDCEKKFPGEQGDLGQIFICLPRTREQAKQYNWNTDYELIRLLIHGLSHLLGFEHENVSRKKIKEMEDFEKKVISQIFIKK
jgi:probable rRNA maturation factor